MTDIHTHEMIPVRKRLIMFKQRNNLKIDFLSHVNINQLIVTLWCHRCSTLVQVVWQHQAMTWTNGNTLRLRQNGRHFTDDTFKRIFLNENVRILFKISLKFVPEGPVNNIPTLVQIMVWRLISTEPLSEPMMVRLPMHIFITLPQWVNSSLSITTLNTTQCNYWY